MLRSKRGDVLEGLQQYSRYALDVLFVENAVRIDNLEGLIYELAGEPRVVTRQILEQAAHTAGVTAPLEVVVDALVEATFLGLRLRQINSFTDMTKLISSSLRQWRARSRPT